MFYDEHNPPHFHVRYNGHKAEIAIQTLALLAGRLPPRVMGLVMEWAEIHKSELMADWQLAKVNKQPAPIAPLQ